MLGRVQAPDMQVDFLVLHVRRSIIDYSGLASVRSSKTEPHLRTTYAPPCGADDAPTSHMYLEQIVGVKQMESGMRPSADLHDVSESAEGTGRTPLA